MYKTTLHPFQIKIRQNSFLFVSNSRNIVICHHFYLALGNTSEYSHWAVTKLCKYAFSCFYILYIVEVKVFLHVIITLNYEWRQNERQAGKGLGWELYKTYNGSLFDNKLNQNIAGSRNYNCESDLYGD